MKKWTEEEALDYLLLCGAEKTGPKTIWKKNGWIRLRACSAMDFLIKLNYTFKLIKFDKPKKTKKTGDAVAGFFVQL